MALRVGRRWAATAATRPQPGVHVRLVAEALGQVEISVGG